MESFSVTSQLTREDWSALTAAVRLRARERLRRKSPVLRWVPFLAWVMLTVAIGVATWAWPSAFQVESLLLGFLLMAAFMVFLSFRQQKAFVPAEDGAFIGRTEFHFTRGGMTVIRAHSRGDNAWRLVRDVSHTPAHVFLWVDDLSAYVFRVADLPAPMIAGEAVARLTEFRAEAAAVSPVAPASEAARIDVAAPYSPATAATFPATPSRPSVWQELKALLHLEMMRSTNADHLFGRDATILLLSAVAVALWIGLDRLNFGSGAEFMWFGLSSISTGVCIALLLAWVLARLSSPPLPLRRTALLVAGCSPLVVSFAWLMDYIGATMFYIALLVLTVWVVTLAHSGLRVMTGMRQARAIVAATAILGVVAYFSAWLLPGGSNVWYQPDADFEPDSANFAAREQLQFEQALRIDAALAKLPAGDPEHAALYFLGFAGYGEQRVFAGEIATAARVVGEKYSLGGRELRLVNDRRDETTWPAASVSALRHALLGLGLRMNRDNDVLFLALSSHGDQDATLSVMNDALSYWRDLNVADLRAMLDESGIRWRVIVISACHAGSFIPALADENTIVLTAAAKENASFGCSDDRDLTYFGEAFYRDALPQAPGLREAFEQARVAIARREKSERVDESDPQAHFGAALEAKLTGMSGGDR